MSLYNIEWWRPAAGYPGFEVSTKGRARDALTGRVLRCFPNWDRYLEVELAVNLVYRTWVPVHELIAATFLGPPGPDQVAVHKNGRSGTTGRRTWSGTPRSPDAGMRRHAREGVTYEASGRRSRRRTVMWKHVVDEHFPT